MKRRKALKQIGLGVTAGLALPWLSSCADLDNDPEIDYGGVVGIIGAGAAGLFAADYLMSKGIKVKIFEASGRIGGRIRSVKISDLIFSNLIADFPVELGADRVLGSDSEFGKLVKLLKVPTVDFRGGDTNAVDKCILDNQYKRWSDVEGDADIAALINFKNNILPGYIGAGSVQAAAGLNGRANKILNSMLGNPYGSSADKISAQALGEALSLIEHDGKELTLNINPMSDVILSRFSKAAGKVKLNKAVKSIDYSGELITLSISRTEINESGELITTNDVTSETVSKLIVTVPVSILKEDIIAFTPTLPSTKTSALANIDMDKSIRIILEFTRNDIFGADTAFILGAAVAQSAFLTGVGRSSVNGNRTFGFTINNPTEEFSAKTDIEKVEELLAELDAVSPSLFASRDVRRIGDPGEEEIVYIVKDWSKEPYIKGGQSYPKVGGTNADRVDLAAAVDEKLFFAGEATDMTGEFGTVSGALKSGRRAAEEVIASIVATA